MLAEFGNFRPQELLVLYTSLSVSAFIEFKALQDGRGTRADFATMLREIYINSQHLKRPKLYEARQWASVTEETSIFPSPEDDYRPVVPRRSGGPTTDKTSAVRSTRVSDPIGMRFFKEFRGLPKNHEVKSNTKNIHKTSSTKAEQSNKRNGTSVDSLFQRRQVVEQSAKQRKQLPTLKFEKVSKSGRSASIWGDYPLMSNLCKFLTLPELLRIRNMCRVTYISCSYEIRHRVYIMALELFERKGRRCKSKKSYLYPIEFDEFLLMLNQRRKAVTSQFDFPSRVPFVVTVAARTSSKAKISIHSPLLHLTSSFARKNMQESAEFKFFNWAGSLRKFSEPSSPSLAKNYSLRSFKDKSGSGMRVEGIPGYSKCMWDAPTNETWMKEPQGSSFELLDVILKDFASKKNGAVRTRLEAESKLGDCFKSLWKLTSKHVIKKFEILEALKKLSGPELQRINTLFQSMHIFCSSKDDPATLDEIIAAFCNKRSDNKLWTYMAALSGYKIRRHATKSPIEEQRTMLKAETMQIEEVSTGVVIYLEHSRPNANHLKGLSDGAAARVIAKLSDVYQHFKVDAPEGENGKSSPSYQANATRVRAKKTQTSTLENVLPALDLLLEWMVIATSLYASHEQREQIKTIKATREMSETLRESARGEGIASKTMSREQKRASEPIKAKNVHASSCTRVNCIANANSVWAAQNDEKANSRSYALRGEAPSLLRSSVNTHSKIKANTIKRQQAVQMDAKDNLKTQNETLEVQKLMGILKLQEKVFQDARTILRCLRNERTMQ